jgi:hypothetical protein
VTWIVAAPDASDGAINVSKQPSLSFRPAGWTLLAEFTSILRLAGDNGDATLRPASPDTQLLGATPGEGETWRIPSTNGAPEFYVVGNAVVQERQVQGFRIRYVADDSQRVADLGLIDRHGDALRYLAPIVFPDNSPPDEGRSLLVVWVGLDERHREGGGMAGSRSFVSNYLTDAEGKASGKNQALTLMVLAHEQFHQLVEIKRGALPALAAWINEGLAQYYGLRAMTVAMGNDADAQALSREFIDPRKAVEYKFPEIEKTFATDPARVHDLAYRQGATFWAELDHALKAAPHGQRGLDGLISPLLEMDFPTEGGLPDAFLNLLRTGNNRDVEQVLRKYMGAGDGEQPIVASPPAKPKV